MSTTTPVIAIVGRTNVGKSTLFNRLVGRKVAIIEDQPGVTRDRAYAYVTKYSKPFYLVDTGGLVGEEGFELADAVREQTEAALAEADMLIVLLDGLTGLHPLDYEVADRIRRWDKPVFWVVNKCDSSLDPSMVSEFYGLGIEELFPISAGNNRGIESLVEQICEAVPEAPPLPSEEEAEKQPIKLAVIGRPNVGKSTLINRLVGEERVVISDIPGTTRDSIYIDFINNDHALQIIDTAGLRRKTKIAAKSIERFSTLRTLKALAECDVALLLLDASGELVVDQDRKIAKLIHDRGKGLVVVVNKWDTVEKNHHSVKDFEKALHSALRFSTYAPLVFTSAKTGRRCQMVLDKALQVYQQARERISTSKLNQILKKAFEHNQPPVFKGRKVKLYFATQIDVAPPQIVLFSNQPSAISNTYLRYLSSCIRAEYPFIGSDIKLFVREANEQRGSRNNEGTGAIETSLVVGEQEQEPEQGL